MNAQNGLVQNIRAIALTVSDVDRSRAFYSHALEFEFVSDVTAYKTVEEARDTQIRVVTLRLGDEQIKLTQYLDIKGKPIPEDSQSHDLWFQHLAIVVRDFDRAYDHLKSFEIEPISTAPQTIPPDNQASAGVRAFKFKDPDLHDLELIWFPPNKGQSKWQQNSDRLFLGIDHTAITVANTEQSLYFYHDLLGMAVDGGSLNQGETQACLDGLPEAKVRITSLRPVKGGLGIELLDYLTPDNGCSIPVDWKSWDLAAVQTEFAIDRIEAIIDRLQPNSGYSISSNPEHCLIRDPNGHRIVLINSI